MFDLGIAEATSSHSVKMRCGCDIQNYSLISMWTSCSLEHDWILLLGAQLTNLQWGLEVLLSTRKGGR